MYIYRAQTKSQQVNYTHLNYCYWFSVKSERISKRNVLKI